jgi:hypothetical protein
MFRSLLTFFLFYLDSKMLIKCKESIIKVLINIFILTLILNIMLCDSNEIKFGKHFIYGMK